MKKKNTCFFLKFLRLWSNPLLSSAVLTKIKWHCSLRMTRTHRRSAAAPTTPADSGAEATRQLRASIGAGCRRQSLAPGDQKPIQAFRWK